MLAFILALFVVVGRVGEKPNSWACTNGLWRYLVIQRDLSLSLLVRFVWSHVAVVDTIFISIGQTESR